MNEQVKYVITQEEWDDNFDKVRGREREREKKREKATLHLHFHLACMPIKFHTAVHYSFIQ